MSHRHPCEYVTLGALLETVEEPPGNLPTWRAEDAVSASAIPATNCELECTESCERVSSLPPVGEDIFSLVHSTAKFLFCKNFFKTAALRHRSFLLFHLGQFPASLSTKSPIPQSQFELGQPQQNRPPANAWFQLVFLNISKQFLTPAAFGFFLSHFLVRLSSMLVTSSRPLLPRHNSSFRLGKPLVQLRNQFVRLSRV